MTSHKNYFFWCSLKDWLSTIPAVQWNRGPKCTGTPWHSHFIEVSELRPCSGIDFSFLFFPNQLMLLFWVGCIRFCWSFHLFRFIFIGVRKSNLKLDPEVINLKPGQSSCVGRRAWKCKQYSQSNKHKLCLLVLDAWTIKRPSSDEFQIGDLLPELEASEDQCSDQIKR